MTREEAKNKIEILNAYAEGKVLQIAHKGQGDWEDTHGELAFVFDRYDYRVKPESKLRPYANAKEFLEAAKEHGPYFTGNTHEYVFPATVYDNQAMVLNGREVHFIEFGVMLDIYTWQDGTPCGVIED